MEKSVENTFLRGENASQGPTTIIVVAPFYIRNGQQNQRINARIYGK